MRRWLVLGWLWIALAAGCARKPAAPSAAGELCRTQADCNRSPDGGTRSCGVLRLCVAGRCEATSDGGARGSRVVVCRADAGAAD